MANTLLILHCDILTDSFSLLRSAYVLIEDGLISKIGPMDRQPAIPAATILDGSGKLIIPGLINGHNHSAMTLFRGMADDLELGDWLNNHIFPAEAQHVSEEMVYWCSKLAAAEMLLSGTTCVADGYFFMDQTAKAFAEAGIRAIVAHGILDFPAPGVPDPAENIATVTSFVERWINRSPLISPAVFAHSPYTCSAETLKHAKQLADDNSIRFFIHLAESRNEIDMITGPAGTSPLKHLYNLGILDDNCVCIHAIWLDHEDLDLLAKSGAHVVLCPQSNFKLASGYSPAAEMLRRRIPIGLGTDGCASNNSLDMFREMDVFAKAQKARNDDPTMFPAAEVFKAATVNNSMILGLRGSSSIAVGNPADLVLIDLQSLHLTPFYNAGLLVYSASGNDVDTVIVNGEIVVKERQLITFDLEQTKNKVREFAAKLQ